MRKMSVLIQYYIHCLILYCLWMTNYTSKASYDQLSRNPLEGSPQRFPGDTDINNSWLGANYSYYGNKDLTRLLDVGADSSFDDPTISFVPSLDATAPEDTLRQSNYFMKFVFFDLQLLELKSVDPVGGSFRAEFQMILHWVDTIVNGSNGTTYGDQCSFLCDTSSPEPLCCDHVWVPPLRLSRCDINKIQSSTPTPNVYSYQNDHAYIDCFLEENKGDCMWRRLWNLNIDATCAAQMDFHNFPFDVQSLSIDILNPYASRTRFQLTTGFLQQNIGEDINNINLSPDAKISGWYVKDLIVSSTCGTSKNWKQTFLIQDYLLRRFNKSYVTQQKDIVAILDPTNLKCSSIEDFISTLDEDVRGSIDYLIDYLMYQKVTQKYAERVKATIKIYKKCIQENGQDFFWNRVIPNSDPVKDTFNTSTSNIDRSFVIFDLAKNNTIPKVSFRCAISAIANLTTPGIRVTILVQRYRLFYVVKLILPTIACVAFSFAAFGLDPEELVGRLTVVVPSAIALTALQGFVVASDIPPIAYIAPSTYIFLSSYIVQLLISFESVFVSRLSRSNCWGRRRSKGSRRLQRSFTMRRSPNQYFNSLTHEQGTQVEQSTQNDPTTRQTEIELTSNWMQSETSARKERMSNALEVNETCCGQMDCIRVGDMVFMAFVAMLYIIAILCCTIPSFYRSKRLKSETSSSNFVSIWKN